MICVIVNYVQLYFYEMRQFFYLKCKCKSNDTEGQYNG